MPPVTKSGKVAKKGKAMKKKTSQAAPAHIDMDWTSGDEDGLSVRNLLTNMSTMLVALTFRVNAG